MGLTATKCAPVRREPVITLMDSALVCLDYLGGNCSHGICIIIIDVVIKGVPTQTSEQ